MFSWCLNLSGGARKIINKYLHNDCYGKYERGAQRKKERAGCDKAEGKRRRPS